MHESFDKKLSKRMTNIMASLQPHEKMYCEKENEYGKKHGYSFYLMPNGEYKCSLCGTSALSKAFQEEMTTSIRENKLRAVTGYLNDYSLFRDRTLEDARFENYLCDDRFEEEIRTNKAKAQTIAKRLASGEVFNVTIKSSTAGAGKSHLAMSILHAINDSGAGKKVAFIESSVMYSRVKQSFNDKESKYTEAYFEKIAKEADVLVIDDLGAELGAMDSEKVSSDYATTLIRSIVDTRQDKATIFTTNLDSKKIRGVYDLRVASRVLRGMSNIDNAIIFNTTKDLRVTIDAIKNDGCIF